MYQYDAIPYESLCYNETHPQRLAVLGRLFGIDTVATSNCRLLELGSATGGNIIPMAFYNPDAEFVGVELEASQIKAGQALIDKLGLKNIRLLQGDIMHLGKDLGQFDYIVAHGVYSWVPAELRDAMMKLYKTLLKPKGIAYISYNTRPGWNARGAVREMLLYHVRHITDAIERLNTALAFIDMIVATLSTQKTPLSRYMLDEFSYLQSAHPSYVYHEFIEDNNDAFLFSDFIAHASRHGLRYLCESQLAGMFSSTLGTQAESFLDQYHDLIEHEQYLDFLTQRTFRQTLLCHADITPCYDLDLSIMEQFACHSQLKPTGKLELRTNTAQRFTSHTGKIFEVRDPISKHMLKQLYDAYPNAILTRDMLESARAEYHQLKKSKQTENNSSWQAEFFNLFVGDAIELVVAPTSMATAIGEMPKANALVCAQAEEGNNLTSVWHETVHTDAFSQHMLRYLDGQHTAIAISTIIADEILSGKFNLPGINNKLPSRDRLVTQINSNIDRLLVLFSRNGLLN